MRLNFYLGQSSLTTSVQVNHFVAVSVVVVGGVGVIVGIVNVVTTNVVVTLLIVSHVIYSFLGRGGGGGDKESNEGRGCTRRDTGE